MHHYRSWCPSIRTLEVLPLLFSPPHLSFIESCLSWELSVSAELRFVLAAGLLRTSFLYSESPLPLSSLWKTDWLGGMQRALSQNISLGWPSLVPDVLAWITAGAYCVHERTHTHTQGSALNTLCIVSFSILSPSLIYLIPSICDLAPSHFFQKAFLIYFMSTEFYFSWFNLSSMLSVLLSSFKCEHSGSPSRV